MKRKTLRSIIVAASAIGLFGLAGCEQNSEYYFDGKIGKEYVKFWEESSYMVHLLEVTREDGKKIRYIDNELEDLKIDSVKVTFEGKEEVFKKTDYPAAIEEAQKQFNEYLQKIKETKAKRPLELIKKDKEEKALDLIKKDEKKEEKPGVYAD